MFPEGLNTMSVGEFYRNRNVLITGATGFLGKALLEKLLRSCEDIGTVYVLIRPKKGDTVEERLHKLLSQDVFNRMHEEIPSARNKVVAVAGDLADPQFSFNERDKTLLENVISVVFHSAAIIKFDEELKYAINMNIGGTKHMIDLAKQMKNLKKIRKLKWQWTLMSDELMTLSWKADNNVYLTLTFNSCQKLIHSGDVAIHAFIYISTAYSNSDRFVIEEKYYPPRAPDHFWQDLLLAAEKIDEKELNALTPRLIGNLPNNYTFTKQISESLVYDHKDDIPIVIYRPSIVTSAFFEPYPGWVDNINGATGIFTGYYTGFLRMMLGTKYTMQDYIGIDFAVNGAIAAAWYRSQLPAGECPLYNCAFGKFSLNFDSIIREGGKLTRNVPTEKTLWKPRMTLTTSFLWFQINFIIFNVIPAYFIDIALKMSGVNFSLMKVCRKSLSMCRVLSYFTLTSFDIKHENFLKLYNDMNTDDKQTFNFDLSGAYERADDIMASTILGIKQYILKDDMNTDKIKILKSRVKYYDAADIAVRIMFYALITNTVWNLVQSFIISQYLI